MEDSRIDACPECGGRIVSGTEVVCRDCGLVFESSPSDLRPRRQRRGRATVIEPRAHR